jgi:hypothetical protein
MAAAQALELSPYQNGGETGALARPGGRLSTGNLAAGLIQSG